MIYPPSGGPDGGHDGRGGGDARDRHHDPEGLTEIEDAEEPDRKMPIRARVPITMPKGPVMASTIPCRSVWIGRQVDALRHRREGDHDQNRGQRHG